MKAKTTIQDPPSTPPASENNLERGDYPEPGQQTAGGGGVNHRAEPAPSSSIAGAKGVMGGGRGSSGKYSGVIGGGDTTKAKGVMGR